MGNKQYEGVAESTREKAQQKTQAQIRRAEELINKIGLNQNQALQIATLNVWELIQLLNSNKISSLQIVLSLIIRTVYIGKKLHLYTQTNFDYAIDAAIKCDEARKTSNKKNWTFSSGPFLPDKHLPPLYGIPISIKDAFHMEGFLTTVGLLSRADNIEPENSPIIDCFINSGMIPFVRSNLPQLGMSAQSTNDIWGRALNPWNQDRAVGGSSGGQGGLIAGRCSILGIGSDIAGSLRIPAEFCGIFSIKPFSKRIPASYHTKFSQGFSGSSMVIPLCIGSLAKSAEDLAYFMKVSLTSMYYGYKSDPFLKNIQFNDKQYGAYKNLNRRLRIGVLSTLKDVQPSLASQRAINEVKKLLTQLGHECMEIQMPNEKKIIKELFKQNLGCQGKMFTASLAGEEPMKEYKSLFQLFSMTAPIRGIAQCYAKCSMPRINQYVLESSIPMSGAEYQEHIGAIMNYRQDWIKYWKKEKLDFVINPGYGCQALLHGNSENTALAAAYTFIWNVLDVSAGSIPITTVQPNQQSYNSTFNDLLTDSLKKNAQNSVGLPVGIQIVALPYQEQKILGFMSYLEPKIGFYKKNPLPNPQ